MSGTTTTDTSAVTVVPETFLLVDYDAAQIAEVAARVWQQVGLPVGQPLRIEVDESTPLGRAWVSSSEPAVLSIESGGLEHNHRPRQFDGRASALLFGRLLMRLRDRLDPAFGDAPSDDDLTLPQSAAWDAFAVGRVGRRLGLDVQRQRRLYQFRVRHGFTDAADNVFDRLWTAESLSWADIDGLSVQARGED
ncbi:MAG TPA: hypothetical protein VK611_16715 [Acidimicrobiales bacterium]|nr:hypothetical protein [Acidimicrobiales bacterium]